MIIGIGIDMAAIERISAIYVRYGAHFLRRILHDKEIERLPSSPQNYLAGRFAAKEAIVKALGTGFSLGIGPAQIEIANRENGQPYVTLHGKAADYARHLSVGAIHVSITHERDFAMAFAILEG